MPTQLKAIGYLAERISSTTVKRALKFTRITAEGIYGRSGLMTCDDHTVEFYVHSQPDKNKAKHKILADQQERNRFEKVKDILSTKGRERWFDYGYTKTHNEYKEEPKYGYALVSPAELSRHYEDKKSVISKRIIDLESPLKDSLTTFCYEIIPFNKTHLKNYFNARKERANLTLLAYLKDNFHLQKVRLAYFDDDDRDLRDLSLSAVNLDQCIFDNSIFPVDLTNTNLCNSFLRHAYFREVEQAQGLDLFGAHAEYLEAAGANLSQAILRGTPLLGANLAKANQTDANILGVSLIESNLNGTISPLVNLQDIQVKQKEPADQQQHLQEKQSSQSKEILVLRKTISDLQAKNQMDIAEKLDEFLQERAARESLARYIKVSLKSTLSKHSNQQNSVKAENLQSLDHKISNIAEHQPTPQSD